MQLLTGKCTIFFKIYDLKWKYTPLFVALSLLTLDAVKKVNFEQKGDHFSKKL